MKRIFKSALSFLLVAVMVLGAAPLSGFVGLERPKIDGIKLPEFKGFDKIKTAVSDFFDGFAPKAEAATSSGTFGYGLSWSFDDLTGTLNVTGQGSMPQWKTFTDVPWYAYKNKIEYASIGSGITNIGSYAFYGCTNLLSVMLSDTVESIGTYTFYGCARLSNIDFSEITYIGDYSFYNCISLSEVEFHGDIIRAYSFYGCTSLVEVFIPQNILIISEYAFGECKNLTQITFADDLWLHTISEGAFSGTGIKSFTMPFAQYLNSPYSRGFGSHIFYNCKNLQSVYFDSNYEIDISSDMFWGCTNLENVTLPNEISSIGGDAFRDCVSLKKIVIPKEVEFIGSSAFWGCTGLTEVIFEDDSALEAISSFAFAQCTSISSIDIPDGTQYIDSYAFRNCSNLKTINIPASVIDLDEYAFYGCKSLMKIDVDKNNPNYSTDYYWFDNYGVLYNKDKTKLISFPLALSNYSIPYGVTTIGDYAFAFSDALKTVIIPNSVTKIGNSAFWQCKNLSEITIPESVTRIESSFAECINLKSINVAAGNTVYSSDENGVLFSEDKSVLYRYPAGNPSLEYIVPDSVVQISDSAFAHTSALISITMSSNVKSLGSQVFYKCTSLEKIVLSDRITKLPVNVFMDCSSLKTITIPDSIKTIENSAFSNCSSLKTINIPAGVTSIASSAFNKCVSLTEINVATGNNYFESIDGVLFNKGQKILLRFPAGKTKTGLPTGLLTISPYAFSDCIHITDFIIPETVTNIGERAFQNCTGLTQITIPKNVRVIGVNAFSGCTSLSIINYNAENCTSAGTNYSYSFANCNGLTTINLGDSVKVIPSNLFRNCPSLKNIVAAENITSIGDYAFYGCENLTKVFCKGSKNQYKSISIGVFNDPFIKARTTYNCVFATEVSIDPNYNNLSLEFGKTQSVSYSVLPENVSDRSVIWSSSDPNVATVSSEGKITAISPGTATITAYASCAISTDIKDSITVTVKRKSRTIPSPAIVSSTGVSVLLSEVVLTEGDGIVEYGWSLQNDSSIVTNWQTDLSFDGLSIGPKYYFFSRVTGSSTYADAYSNAQDIDLNNILITGSVTINKNGVVADSAFYGETLAADINIEGEYTFCWYRGNEKIENVNGNYYTLGIEDINCNISVIAKGDEAKGYTGNITSRSVSVTKETAETPFAPVLYEATANSITFVAEKGQQYRLDKGVWIIPENETHTYKGLYENEIYEVSSYIPESETCFASEISPALTVITALTYSLDDSYLDQQGVKYNINFSAKTAAVTSSTSTVTKSEIMIPQYVWKDGVQYKVTAVSANAFSGCSRIKTVTLSDTITTIESKAFYGCSNLSEAYFDGTAPSSFGGNVFDSASSGFLIYYYPLQAGWTGRIVAGKYNGYYAISRNAIEEIQRGSSDKNVYIVYVTDTSGNSLSDATINFNGISKNPNTNGYAFFEKPSGSSVSLNVSLKGYHSFSEEKYPLSENISFSCIQLSDDPSVINKAICNGDDVITGRSQINCALDLWKAEFVIEGYSQYEIIKYEIVQENKVIAESKNGKFTIKNTKFTDKQQIIAVMHTSDGKTASKVLNITVVKYDLASSIPFSLGSETKITIPENVLPFGELSLGFDFEKFPVTFEVTNESIRLGVNMDVKSKTTKELDEDLEDLRELASKPVSKFKFALGAGGYVDAKISKDGIKVVERNGYIWATVGFTVGNTFWLGYIPIRVEFSVNAKGEVAMALAFDFENVKWKKIEIGLTLSLNANLHAGVGTRVASAGIFGDATIKSEFKLLPETYPKKAVLSGKTGLYIKGGTIFKWRLEYIIFQGEKVLYERPVSQSAFQPTSLVSTIPQMFNLVSAVYNEENYKLVDRDYLETRSGWLSAEETQNASTFSARALLANSVSSNSVSSNNNTLQTSVFSNIEPKIITCNETTMMIYTDDNGGEDAYNNMELVYSIYDEASDTWSVPVRVGGVDFNEGISDVYTDGNDIYIAYIQTNRMFTADDKMSDYAAASEIAVAKFDFENGTFEEPVVITDNDTADMMPEFAVVDSVPCVVWINNKDNDTFAMTANNALCYSRFKNGSWSEPVELISASPTITSSAIGSLGSKAYIAITRDIDCDLETNNDRYVSLVDFEGNVIDIATENNNNEYINYVTENGVNKFIWLCDGNLMSITGADSEVTQILENPVPALSGGYQLVENNNGGFDILFTEAVGDGSEVYGMFYDEGWCLPVKVTRTETDRYVESYAATYIGDKLLIPYLSTAVTFINEKMETSADLCCTTVEFKSDLKTENAEIDYDNLMEEPEVSTFSLRRNAKTATVNLKVSNNGLSKVESVTVSIPELSYSQSQSVTIMPGEAKEISAVFNLPDDITADDLTVTVSPTGSDDMDSTDNSASFKIGYTDFSVAAEQRILGNQDYILAAVTNNGNLAGNAVLKVIKDNLDGETLYELAIENLGVGETRYYMIETDSGFFDENSDCGLITVYAETDTLEEIDYNNYEFVVLNHFNREIVDTENLVPNSSIGATSAVFDKYAPQDITVEIDANGNTFEGVTELSTNNYTVGENVIISKSYLSTLEVGSYDFTFVFSASETQTQERVFTVVVEDSSPVTPEIIGEQISDSVYDGKAIEEDVDFAIYTNSDGAITFSYSSDNCVTWTSGLPVFAGTYLIKADVAATEEYVASSTQFNLTIGKACRAIPSPAAITVTNSSVSLTTVIPTVFESEDTVYYGYSITNDASTINNWSLNPVFDGLNANTEYYFFAKVSGGNNYADVISVVNSVKTSKNSVDAPTAPVLSSKTDTSVTLLSADGYEYRCNDGEWQSKNTFEGLNPNQSYSFTQRIAETENSYASAPSVALVVTTDKSVTQAPEAPDIEGKTDTTVTLSHTNGYEYRCNDGVWTDSNIFTVLDRNTEYSFYQRVSETDISYASESSEALTVITDKTELSGTVVINGIAQTAENLTADVSAVKPAEAQFTYQWYSDGNAISGETSAEYTVTYNDLGHEISVEITGINDFKGTLISASVIPVAASANGIVSIEGDPVYGNDLTATVTELNPSYAEYAMQWYRGDTPIGGATKEKYTVAKEDIGQQLTVRITGVNGYDISVSSAGVIPVKQTVDAPQAPKAETVTSDSITLVSNDGYEYRIGNGEWQSDNVFTSDSNGNALMPDTEYAFSQRVKETETAFASAESEIAVITTNPIRVESISISETNIEIVKTYPYQLWASVSPENATDKNIIWSSSDESVATVDQNGFVTANESGNAVITAKSADGGFTASCVITVVPDTYTVIWNVNGEKTTHEVRYSEYITVPQNPVADGYEFIGWTPEIPQTMPLYDLEFTAVFEPIEYYAEFVADGVMVIRIPYTVETYSINTPDVPDKIGYSGKWENYELTIGGITVNAVYTVNNYKVTWVVDGKETQMSVNYGESIDKSFVPQKDGYKFMGWTPDVPQTMPAKNLAFTAVWFANSYDAVFNANGGMWFDGAEEKVISTSFNSQIVAPEIPTKQGYVFSCWTPEVGIMDSIDGKTFVAEWIPATDTRYVIETYTMNTSGEYEKLSQMFSGTTGETVTVEFSVITGFTLNAEKSVLSGTIAADSSLVLKVYIDRNIYTLTTVSDGVSTETKYYYGAMISELASPVKEGYKFMGWDTETPSAMPAENITVTAVFEKSYICPDCGDEVLGENNINAHIAAEARMKATVKIKNNSGSKTIKYGETLRLTAITTNMPADARVYWYVDGIMQGEGDTFNVRFESGTKTVEVKIVDSNGNVLKNSSGNEIFDSEEVTVKGGFFQKIISFFKNLFGMNRTIIQSVFKGTF